MSVSVKIVNKVIDQNKNEYQAALALKTMLEHSFSDKINGNIGIAYSLTLCGQEVRDIDLFLFGKLDNYVLSKFYTNNPQYPKKDLKVDGFCIAIELKEHPLSRVDISNTHAYVEYHGAWKDATDQNEKQRYSCASYLETAVGYKIFTTNFLWLKGLTYEQLKDKANNNKIGALSTEFTFNDIVNIVIDQGLKPFYDNSDKTYHLRPCEQEGFYNDIKKNLFYEKTPIADLTKQKLEILMQSKVDQQLTQKTIGNKLTILKGRAGTGKTFHLIQSALRLANPETGKRCLLLTYNHALVSDIRRLLHFMNIPDGIDNYTVQIQTLHSFFIQLMKALEVPTSKIVGNVFDREYKKSLKELHGCIKELMNDKDISTLKEENELAIDWDYVLVDEAQDWMDLEKEILFKVYGESNIVVADGIDQFMRGNLHQHWTRGVTSSDTIQLEVGMRQKTNLVNFVNAFASKLNVKWNVKCTALEQWAGGRIIVMDNYDSTTHINLQRECKRAGGDNYDMLFLVPYQMAPHCAFDKDPSIHPIDLDVWKKSGICLFDGTSTDKEQYTVDTNECRLYQYDSCRGLEGWATICFKFDILVDNKIKLAKQIDFPEELVLRSKEDRVREYAYLWSLMPLTRAIDTLVITLHDSNSLIGQILKDMAFGDYSDIISWKCK